MSRCIEYLIGDNAISSIPKRNIFVGLILSSYLAEAGVCQGQTAFKGRVASDVEDTFRINTVQRVIDNHM